MELVKLGKICDLKNGFAFKSKDYIETSNTLSCRMSSIRPGGSFDLHHNKKYLPDSFALTYSDYLLNDGDIVIAMTDLAGDPKILGVPTIVNTEGNNLLQNQRVGKLIIKNKEKIFTPYLQYALNRPENKNYYKKFAGGGLQINVGKKEILNNKIPLPPLAEQQRIAGILDEADQLRQLNKQLITKYEQLSQSLFLEMFGDPVTNPKGWEKVEMNKLCDFSKTSIKPENIKPNTKYIPLDAIQKETGNIIDYEMVSKKDVKSNKFYFNNKHILYGKLRPYLNKVALPLQEGICSTDIIPIQPLEEKTNRYFISKIMKNKGFVDFANERSSGANLPRISPKEVEKYKCINPPIQLQTQFAARVQLIEQQKQQAQEALQKSDNLFNALLQKAFKGGL
ncbi:hypothetical protein BA195_04060 [Tenacibaculum soleae]|uniref:Type I restriction modification DNA specificity domain-containing protein n=1 Tax=Tenacibaculum soleae TaxID=447689 RepID=A0A1B9Y2A3_9FLAO|nr:restriction endonuclease subunit S [Tenacibaculum soleae]OCK43879.1 hypothetical protein BA195_04060 [Tenacibaculum soleae]